MRVITMPARAFYAKGASTRVQYIKKLGARYIVELAKVLTGRVVNLGRFSSYYQ